MDYYEQLGVAKNASADDIKKAVLLHSSQKLIEYDGWE